MVHMKKITVLAIAAAVLLSACSNSNQFDGGAAAGVGGSGLAGDPTSPAYFQQTIGDRVFFEVDQATLTAAAQTTLDEQARWLTDNAAFSALIEGHADEQGTREYNIALSASRANAVSDYLISRGVASGRITTVPFGKERPVAVCSSESCYSQNRRAVTVLQAAGALGS